MKQCKILTYQILIFYLDLLMKKLKVLKIKSEKDKRKNPSNLVSTSFDSMPFLFSIKEKIEDKPSMINQL